MQARFLRSLLVLCMGMAVIPTVFAQNAARIYIEPNGWAIGMNAGMSDLFGDVGTQSFTTHYTNSNYTKRMAAMGGFFARYTIHPALGITMGLNYGSLYATDKWNYDLALAAPDQGADGYQRYARAQNARDFIFEGSFMFEVTPLRSNPEGRLAHRRGQPYLGVGVAYFHYEPYSTVNYGQTFVKTHDLSIEGQDFGDGFPKKESLWQLAVPMAIGYRWDLGKHLNLGIEYKYRLTFTDYLDGVSGKYISKKDFYAHLPPKEAQIAYEISDKSYFAGLSQPNVKGNMRGNPENNDSYSTFSITFYYKLLTRTSEWWNER